MIDISNINNPTPVGVYPHGVGPAGHFDLAGNVWEWCQDNWHDNYKGAPDDGRAWVGDPRGAYRVFRGGGWGSNAQICRSASRNYGLPDSRNADLGFRLARSVSLGP